MTRVKIAILALTALSFWMLSNGPDKSVPSRAPASEDFESREQYDEDTDYYDSYQFQRDPSLPKKAQESRPSDPKSKIKKQNNKKKSKDPIGDDAEFSKLDTKTRCQLGQAHACFLLGRLMMMADANQGLKYLARACNLRDFSACEETGKLLKESHGPAAAFRYFQSACENASYASGCYETANYLESVNGETPEKIFSYYRIACLEGSAPACAKING
jgi:hypothetical protein